MNARTSIEQLLPSLDQQHLGSRSGVAQHDRHRCSRSRRIFDDRSRVACESAAHQIDADHRAGSAIQRRLRG